MKWDASCSGQELKMFWNSLIYKFLWYGLNKKKLDDRVNAPVKATLRILRFFGLNERLNILIFSLKMVFFRSFNIY